MIYLFHDNIRYIKYRRNKGTFSSVRKKYSRGLDRSEDCRIAPSFRRAATWVDGPSVGLDADEPEPLGSSRKRARARSSKEQAKVWETFPIDTSDCAPGGAAFGTVSSGVWVESGEVGWAHVCRSFTATVWHKAESAAGSEVDASVRVSSETGKLCLSSRQGRRSKAVSPGAKKNSKNWALRRRWSFRMRRGLACILGWEWGGPKKGVLFMFRPQASINTGLTSRVGSHRLWGGMG